MTDLVAVRYARCVIALGLLVILTSVGLAYAGTVDAQAQPAGESPWTPAMIQELFSGIERILLAIGTLIVGVGGIMLQLRSSRNAGKAAGDARDAKLDAQTEQIGEVKKLVDGPVSSMLRTIADLKEERAVTSGTEADLATAEVARRESDAKDATIDAVEKKEPHE